MADKIKSFTDLIAWKESHRLSIAVYKLTESFPSKEVFSLVSQMRRSALSVSSNIAEGFSRQTTKEKIQFFYTAKGSLTELQNQLLLSRDVGYMNNEKFRELATQTVLCDKLIVGLIKS
jgi:four helix bundle protein